MPLRGTPTTHYERPERQIIKILGVLDRRTRGEGLRARPRGVLLGQGVGNVAGTAARSVQSVGPLAPGGGPAGDVSGPGSSTAGNLAVFADTSGKTIADGGPVPSGGAVDDVNGLTGEVDVQMEGVDVTPAGQKINITRAGLGALGDTAAAASRVLGSGSGGTDIIELVAERGLSVDADGLGLIQTSSPHVIPVPPNTGRIYSQSTGGRLTLSGSQLDYGLLAAEGFIKLQLAWAASASADTLDVWVPIGLMRPQFLSLSRAMLDWSIKTSKETDSGSGLFVLSEIAPARRVANSGTTLAATMADLDISANSAGLSLHSGAAASGTYITTPKTGLAVTLPVAAFWWRLRFSHADLLGTESAEFRIACDDNNHFWGLRY